MSDKACCQTWVELSEELKLAKMEELDTIRTGSNLPKSMFALLYKTLDAMGNYCPVCGTGLVQQDQPLKLTTNKEPPAPPKKLVQYKCGKCRGQGIVSKPGDPDVINCMACLGTGTVTRGQNTSIDGGDLEEYKTIPPLNVQA